MIPIAIEEPSVVAAVSSIGKKYIFEAFSTPNIMIGQVHLPNITLSKVHEIQAWKQSIIEFLNKEFHSMVKRGGGVRDIKINKLNSEKLNNSFTLNIYVNVCEAMGANAVNSICERAKSYLVDMDVIPGIAILSNYCTERLAYGSFEVPINKMGYKGFSGEVVVKKIL